MTVARPSHSSAPQKRELSVLRLLPTAPVRRGVSLFVAVAYLGVGPFQMAARADVRSFVGAAESEADAAADAPETVAERNESQTGIFTSAIWQFRQSVDLPLNPLTEDFEESGLSSEGDYAIQAAAVVSAPRFSVEDVAEMGSLLTAENTASPLALSLTEHVHGEGASDAPLDWGEPEGDLVPEDAADPVENRIVADVPTEVLMASRDRFRELVLEMPGFDLGQIDQSFAGSLGEPTQSRMSRLDVQGPHAGLSVVQGGSLNGQKTYTVVSGQIVEVNPESYPTGAWPAEAESDQDYGAAAFVAGEVIGPEGVLAQRGHPGSQQVSLAKPESRTCVQSSFVFRPQSFDEFLASSTGSAGCAVPAARDTQALAQADVFSPSAFVGEKGYLPGHADFMGHEDATARTGAYVRGRVALPSGLDARSVLVRVAGSSLQVRPDAAGFFELGPFALGTSFELLLFDEDGRLNRRLVPVFVSRQMREPEIQMFRSQEIAQLVRSFRAEHRATDAGFCGEISSADRSLPAVTLADDVGRTQRLWYFSDRGFPAPDLQSLSSSRRICAFGLKGGLYRLSVNGAENRAVFEIHTRPSTFENGMHFDAGARQYVRTVALGLVDSQLSRAALDSGSSQAVSLTQALQNLWLSGQDDPVWAPVVDFLLRSTPAYAPVRVDEQGGTRFVPTGEELVKLFEPESRSFELIGREEVLSARSERRELAHHLLPEDTAQDLRLLLPGQPEESSFLVFGDIDTALLPASMTAMGNADGVKGDRAADAGMVSGDQSRFFDVSVRDVWTGERVASAVFFSNPSDRILRFAIPGLVNGSYLLHIRNPRGQLAWSSVIRAALGETQIVSNR